MSSKAVGQQQQGRRTPLSLSGGKNNNHNQQQQNSNKANHSSNNNSSKNNQDAKDSTTSNKNNNQGAKNPQEQNSNKANHSSNNNSSKHNQDAKDSTTSNKNNNQGVKNQQETRDLKDTTKKTQQNGSKHAKLDNINECVVSLEQIGTTNGTKNSNGFSNKSNGNSEKATNQNSTKANKEDDAEKMKDNETDVVKEKSDQKSKKGDEKKQNEGREKQTTPQQEDSPPTNVTTPITNSAGGGNTPPLKDDNTSSNESEKPSAPSKSDKAADKVEKSARPTTPLRSTMTTRKSATPKKSKTYADVVAFQAIDLTEINENEDIDEPLIIESSPSKKSVLRNAIAPTATSTPGKIAAPKAFKDVDVVVEKLIAQHEIDPSSVARSYSDISGRRSIRGIGEYTPSMYNSKFRESYRRINTELDVTGNTNNTSMNVTVGSEIPNNNSSFLSFSFFGRGRKRERTPTSSSSMPEKSQSAVELSSETTPPKRARLDVNGIFSVMSSPLTMLRTRFSKATLETPLKEKPLFTIADDVQNVSGVSIEEVVNNSAEDTATEDITVGQEAIADKSPSKQTPSKDNNAEEGCDDAGESLDSDVAKTASMDIDGDIKVTETLVIGAVGEPKIKQKGCLIM